LLSGKPTQACLIAIKDDLSKEFVALAVIALVSGALLLLIFICQYCLWKKY